MNNQTEVTELSIEELETELQRLESQNVFYSYQVDVLDYETAVIKINGNGQYDILLDVTMENKPFHLCTLKYDLKEYDMKDEKNKRNVKSIKAVTNYIKRFL